MHALAAPLLAVDAKSEGVDTKSKQNTTEMGKRRRPVPIPGQSKLQFGSKQVEIPLEDALKLGDKYFSDIFSDTESEYERPSSDDGDSEMDIDHDPPAQPRERRSTTSTKCNYREVSSEEEEEEGDEEDEDDDEMDVDEEGHPRNESARVPERKAAIEREQGKLAMANNN